MCYDPGMELEKFYGHDKKIMRFDARLTDLEDKFYAGEGCYPDRIFSSQIPPPYWLPILTSPLAAQFTKVAFAMVSSAPTRPPA